MYSEEIIRLKFVELTFFNARKTPISMVALTTEEEIENPFNYEKKYFLGKKWFRIHEKFNQNRLIADKCKYDFFSDANNCEVKLVQDISYCLLERLVDRFTYDEFATCLELENMENKPLVYNLAFPKFQSFIFGVNCSDITFLSKFISEFAKQIFKIIKNSQNFIHSDDQHLVKQNSMNFFQSSNCVYSLNIESEVKGSPVASKFIEITNLSNFLSIGSSASLFTDMLRVDTETKFTMTIKAIENLLIDENSFEVHSVFFVYPQSAGIDTHKKFEFPLDFILFQDSLTQQIDDFSEESSKEIRNRLKLFREFSQQI